MTQLCRYAMPAARVGECGCPPCDADDCVECIAHVRPNTDGKRYCAHHLMVGTAPPGAKLQGILSHVPAAPRRPLDRSPLDAIIRAGRVRL